MIGVAIVSLTTLGGPALFGSIFIGSSIFDYVYDNKDEIIQDVVDAVNSFGGFIEDTIEWFGDLF